MLFTFVYLVCDCCLWFGGCLLVIVLFTWCRLWVFICAFYVLVVLICLLVLLICAITCFGLFSGVVCACG